jgi:hypothetical protein
LNQQTKAASVFTTELNKAERSLNQINDTINKLSFEKALSYVEADIAKKRLFDLNKELERLRKKEESLAKSKKRFSARAITQQKLLSAKIKQTTKDIEAEGLAVEKFQMSLKKTSEIGHEAFERLGEGASSFGDMIKAIGRHSPRDLGKASKKATEVGKSLSKWGESLTGAKGVMKAFAPAVQKLGMGLGGVSKIMTGPAGWAAMATSALVDIEMRADKFLKEQNKIFAGMRGPNIMSGDVKKQFKDFNDQIFKAMDNIHDGLNVKEVQQFFQAMSDSGTAVGKLNNNFQTYRDVVSVAAKASKNWGVDISYMGQASSDLMQDYRADLSTIDDLFNQVAFDAGKSGLSTDKFWSAIKNATTGLGFYGLAFEGLGKTMGEWTKQQIGGAKDAESALSNMADISKKSFKDAFKYVGLAVETGGYDLGSAIGEQIAKAEKAKLTATPEQRKQLTIRQGTLQKAQSAWAGGDRGKAMRIMSQNMGELADDMPNMVRSILMGNKDLKDASDESSEAFGNAVIFAESLGVSLESVRMLAREMATFGLTIEEIMKASAGQGPLSIDKTLIDKLSSSDAQVQEQGIKELTAVLAPTYKENADALSKLAASDKEIRDALISGNLPKALEALKNDQRRMTKDLGSNNKLSGKTDKQIAMSAQDTFTQLRDGTLSWEEMVNMGLDEGKYWLASMSGAEKLNNLVTQILHAMPRHKESTAAQGAKTKAALGLGIISDMSSVKGQGAAVTEALKKRSLLGGVPQMMGGMTGDFDKKKAIEDVRALSKQVPATALQKDLGALTNKLKEMDAETNPEKMKGFQEELNSLTLAVKTSAEGLRNSYSGLISDLTTNKAVGASANLTGMTAKATMRDPQLITSPGFVKLDPGEMLQPGNFARTTLATLPSAPGSQGPTAGVGGRSITINVSANEKDLATKIANEVRSVLFKERMV